VKFFDRFFNRKAAQLTYDQIADLIDGKSGGTVAGVTVTEKTALQVATVLACVKVIADGCATPALNVFREKPDGRRERADNIPEYRLLARRPNEWQTSFEWRRQMTLHAALTGAGLSIKVRGDNRRVRELIPVQPGQWDVRRVSRYDLRYRCWDDFGVIGEFTPDEVFVINGVQWDWVCSLNAVSLARSAVGLAIATERSQAAMHANGLRPSGTYSVEGTLSKEQYEALTAHLKRRSGPDSTGAPMVLDRGAKWLSTSINGVDAQHVETRRLQIEEMCRAYGVFPIMVGHSDKSSTFASSEAFFSAHVKHTLAPWHQVWTQRIDEMLLDGSGPLFAEFDVRYLMAGSMADRSQWARAMTELGIYTRNEIRDEEGKDPLPGLDEPLTPLNMTTAGKEGNNKNGKGNDDSQD
jgi:HK97 family phage portal protein